MLLVPKFNELKLKLPVITKSSSKSQKKSQKHISPNEEIPGVVPGNSFHSSHSNETYKLLHQVGQGEFSFVWLVKLIRTGEVFAMKILKSQFTSIGIEEVQYFKKLNDNGIDNGTIQLYDYLFINKSGDSNLCLVLEYYENNLLEVIPKLSMTNVKSITCQLLQAIDYIHSQEITHTDLKPENILYSKGVIKITDFGNATSVYDHYSDFIQTRQYRAPEILLGHEWGCGVDIWSIGCIVFELVTGDYLFNPKVGDSFTKDEDHLAQIVELLGAFPEPDYLVDCKKVGDFFQVNHSHLEFKNIKMLKFWKLDNVLVEKYKIDDKLLVDFMLKCLEFDISKRFDAGSLLSHPWLTNVGRDLVNKNYKVKGFDRICNI